jgi:hypothetical protein
MQTIQITLQYSQLEQTVLRLAKQHQKNLQEFIITTLNYYIQETEEPTALNVQKLDPLQHAIAPTESFHGFTAL